jgi:hypothetical protein
MLDAALRHNPPKPVTFVHNLLGNIHPIKKPYLFLEVKKEVCTVSN